MSLSVRGEFFNPRKTTENLNFIFFFVLSSIIKFFGMREWIVYKNGSNSSIARIIFFFASRLDFELRKFDRVTMRPPRGLCMHERAKFFRGSSTGPAISQNCKLIPVINNMILKSLLSGMQMLQGD